MNYFKLIFLISHFIVSFILFKCFLLNGVVVTSDSFRYFTLSIDISSFNFPSDKYLVPIYSFFISLINLFSSEIVNERLAILQLFIFIISGFLFLRIVNEINIKIDNNLISSFSILLFFSYWVIKFSWIIHADSLIVPCIYLFIYLSFLRFKHKEFILGVLLGFFFLVKLNLSFLVIGILVSVLFNKESIGFKLASIGKIITPFTLVLLLYFILNNNYNLHFDFYSKESYWSLDNFLYFWVGNFNSLVNLSVLYFLPFFKDFNLLIYLLIFWIIPFTLIFISDQSIGRIKDLLVFLFILLHTYSFSLVLIRSLVGLSEVTERTMIGFYAIVPLFFLVLVLSVWKIFDSRYVKLVSTFFFIFVLTLNIYRSIEHIYHKIVIKDYSSFKKVDSLKQDPSFNLLLSLIENDNISHLYTNQTAVFSYIFYKKVFVFGLPYDRVFKGDYFVDEQPDIINNKEYLINDELNKGIALVYFSEIPFPSNNLNNFKYVSGLRCKFSSSKFLNSSSILVYK
ncbi:hypothetical protein [Algoriphagus winogradskyi]|uniref:hypothetical protein n=1 Tax=Algoriphagus winogradskyi TaxID=237017 RepID=UPI0024B776CA|nr:hypothetical protein [Algoriphagus winogradskyi]